MFSDINDDSELEKDIHSHPQLKRAVSEVIKDNYQEIFKSSLMANSAKDIKTNVLSGK